MADRPLSAPLPADLPEDWTTGQTVAPSGADVGLSQQHGYNYLMEQVNAAQRAANAINESFDTISGKRTCRVTVGTSTAGWTQADCDYLCDGTDDQEELNAAIAAVLAKGGGEIAVLGGEYVITEQISLVNLGASVSFTGEPGAAVFTLSGEPYGRINVGAQNPMNIVRFFGITFQPGGTKNFGLVVSNFGTTVFDRCVLKNIGVYSVTDGTANNWANLVFCNNLVEANGNMQNNAALEFHPTDYGSAMIAYNIFRVNDIAIAVSAGIYSDGASPKISVTGNSIEKTGTTGGLSLRAAGSVCIEGNSFVGGGAEISGGLFSGNCMESGDIKATGASIIASNKITEGEITAATNTVVSGNSVKAKVDSPAITLFRNGADPGDNDTATVIGNYITGASIGIYLKESALQHPNMSRAMVCSNRIFGCTTPIQIDDNWSECMVTDNLFPAGSSIVNNGTNNIVRLNSDDPGEGGGGGTAGVSSFNGRAGAVTPQNGDYTAEMVGARPDTWTPTAEDVGAVSAGSVSTIQALTQTEYDALTTKNAATLYLIKE